MRMLIGTYTRLGGEGVLLADCSETGLTRLCTAKDLFNPTYIIPTPDGRGFVTNGKSDALDKGYIAQYALEGDSFDLLAKAYIGRDGACHMAFSRDGRTLYTANYHTGSISVLPVENGIVRDATQVMDHIDVLGRDAHAHHVSIWPKDDALLCAVDLGCDSLFFYRRNGETGLLTRVSRVKFQNGMGPRHLCWARGGERCYVVHELASKVSYLKNGGIVQTASTLPEGYAGQSYCAAIRLSKDEKRLFATNRGHDSIAVFSLSADGRARFVKTIPTYGAYPRDMVALDDGTFLCANQNSGSVTCVSPDGALLWKEDVAGAVCICPIESV